LLLPTDKLSALNDSGSTAVAIAIVGAISACGGTDIGYSATIDGYIADR
jgi:hypothetical protein